MRSAIYAADTSIVSGIASGSTLQLGSIIRRVGCACDLIGNSILVKGTGYYSVAASFTLTPSAQDTITIQALHNGVEIPGAVAQVRSSVTTTEPLVFMVRQCCCDSGSISFRVSTAADTTTITQNNSAVDVVKL